MFAQVSEPQDPFSFQISSFLQWLFWEDLPIHSQNALGLQSNMFQIQQTKGSPEKPWANGESNNFTKFVFFVAGREIFVGISGRTNLLGAQAVAKAFPEYPTTIVQVSFILHTFCSSGVQSIENCSCTIFSWQETEKGTGTHVWSRKLKRFLTCFSFYGSGAPSSNAPQGLHLHVWTWCHGCLEITWCSENIPGKRTKCCLFSFPTEWKNFGDETFAITAHALDLRAEVSKRRMFRPRGRNQRGFSFTTILANEVRSTGVKW